MYREAIQSTKSTVADVIDMDKFAQVAISHGLLVDELIDMLRVNGLEPALSDPNNEKLKIDFEKRGKHQYMVCGSYQS